MGLLRGKQRHLEHLWFLRLLLPARPRGLGCKEDARPAQKQQWLVLPGFGMWEMLPGCALGKEVEEPLPAT